MWRFDLDGFKWISSISQPEWTCHFWAKLWPIISTSPPLVIPTGRDDGLNLPRWHWRVSCCRFAWISEKEKSYKVGVNFLKVGVHFLWGMISWWSRDCQAAWFNCEPDLLVDWHDFNVPGMMTDVTWDWHWQWTCMIHCEPDPVAGWALQFISHVSPIFSACCYSLNS